MNKKLIFSIIFLILILLAVYLIIFPLRNIIWCCKAGEKLAPYIQPYSECCFGLDVIGDPESYDQDCNFNPGPGSYGICSDCGNNNCEQWETECNCPEDCIEVSH